MDKNLYEQFIIMQDAIESNKQDIKYNKQEPDEKIRNLTKDFK